MGYFQKIIVGIFIVILLYYPFNGLIGLLAEKHFGNDIYKIIKDAVMLAICLIINVYYITSRGLVTFRRIMGRRVNLWIVSFLLLNIVYVVLFFHDQSTLYGLLLNTRYFLVFLTAQLVADLMSKHTRDKVINTIFFAGVFIAGIALLEFFVPEFTVWLQSQGYWVTGLHVDQNQSFPRSSGTLRGPNELGPYMIIISMIGYYIFTGLPSSKKAQRILVSIAIAICVAANVVAFSRSGYIGMIVAVLTCIIIYYKQLTLRELTLAIKRTKKLFIAGGVVFALICGGLLVAVPETASIIFLHADPSEGSSVNSDNVRMNGITTALGDIVHNPLGHGLGSAGLATFHRAGGGVIPENYYLQIGIEMGVAGLIVFMCITVMMVRAIAELGDRRLRILLMSTFLGITITNLFLHVWADEAVSVVWWAMAGWCIIEKHDLQDIKRVEKRNGRV